MIIIILLIFGPQKLIISTDLPAIFISGNGCRNNNNQVCQAPARRHAEYRTLITAQVPGNLVMSSAIWQQSDNNLTSLCLCLHLLHGNYFSRNAVSPGCVGACSTCTYGWSMAVNMNTNAKGQPVVLRLGLLFNGGQGGTAKLKLKC